MIFLVEQKLVHDMVGRTLQERLREEKLESLYFDDGRDVSGVRLIHSEA